MLPPSLRGPILNLLATCVSLAAAVVAAFAFARFARLRASGGRGALFEREFRLAAVAFLLLVAGALTAGRENWWTWGFSDPLSGFLRLLDYLYLLRSPLRWLLVGLGFWSSFAAIGSRLRRDLPASDADETAGLSSQPLLAPRWARLASWRFPVVTSIWPVLILLAWFVAIGVVSALFGYLGFLIVVIMIGYYASEFARWRDRYATEVVLESPRSRSTARLSPVGAAWSSRRARIGVAVLVWLVVVGAVSAGLSFVGLAYLGLIPAVAPLAYFAWRAEKRRSAETTDEADNDEEDLAGEGD